MLWDSKQEATVFCKSSSQPVHNCWQTGCLLFSLSASARHQAAASLITLVDATLPNSPQCGDTPQNCNKAFLHVHRSLWVVPRIVTQSLTGSPGFPPFIFSSFCASSNQLIIQADVCVLHVYLWLSGISTTGQLYQHYLLPATLSHWQHCLIHKQNSIKLNWNEKCNMLFDSLDVCYVWGLVCIELPFVFVVFVFFPRDLCTVEDR